MTQTTDAALVPEDMQALRVQNSAFRALNRSLEQQIEYHRVRAQEYHAATTTLDSEREANRILTDTIEAQARRIEALEGALRAVAEGNIGPAPWQAGYARLKAHAAAALEPTP